MRVEGCGPRAAAWIRGIGTVRQPVQDALETADCTDHMSCDIVQLLGRKSNHPGAAECTHIPAVSGNMQMS